MKKIVFYTLSLTLAFANYQPMSARDITARKDSCTTTAATEDVHISLNKAFNLASAYNATLQRSRLDYKISREQSASANAIFMPQVDFQYTAMVTDNPLNSFGFKLNQRIVTSQDFMPESLNEPNASHDYSAQLQLQQPLLNLDAIYNRKSARDAARMKQHSMQRTQEYLEFQVEQAYLQIGLSYRNVAVIKESVISAAAFEKRAQGMYDEGMIQLSDLLEAKAYHLKMRSQLQVAQSGIANSSDQLSLLMGQHGDIIYKVDEVTEQMPDKSLESIGNRSDLLAYRAGLSAAENQIRASKMSFLPHLNAFGTYQLNDKKIFGTNANSYMLGISLSWKLFGGTQRIHQFRQTKLERSIVESQLSETERQAQADYNKALRSLNDLELETQQASLMVKQMDEAWRIQKDRYEQGLSPTSDLLRIQSQLAQQRLMLEQIYFKRKVTIAWLHFTIGH